MSGVEKNIRPVSLRAFVGELFSAGGMRPGEADWFAESIVQANLWGIDSHGVIRVPTYFSRVLSGAINRRPSIRTYRKAPALTLPPLPGGPPWNRRLRTPGPTASEYAA